MQVDSETAEKFFSRLGKVVIPAFRKICLGILKIYDSDKLLVGGDICERFKTAVKNLPDDIIIYITLKERLIWINQHSAILRHSTYEKISVEIFKRMTINLFELVVAFFELKNENPLFDKLKNVAAKLYQNYHSICREYESRLNFHKIPELRDLSKFNVRSDISSVITQKYDSDEKFSIQSSQSSQTQEFKESRENCKKLKRHRRRSLTETKTTPIESNSNSLSSPESSSPPNLQPAWFLTKRPKRKIVQRSLPIAMSWAERAAVRL